MTSSVCVTFCGATFRLSSIERSRGPYLGPPKGVGGVCLLMSMVNPIVYGFGGLSGSAGGLQGLKFQRAGGGPYRGSRDDCEPSKGWKE